MSDKQAGRRWRDATREEIDALFPTAPRLASKNEHIAAIKQLARMLTIPANRIPRKLYRTVDYIEHQADMLAAELAAERARTDRLRHLTAVWNDMLTRMQFDGMTFADFRNDGTLDRSVTAYQHCKAHGDFGATTARQHRDTGGATDDRR